MVQLAQFGVTDDLPIRFRRQPGLGLDGRRPLALAGRSVGLIYGLLFCGMSVATNRHAKANADCVG